MEDAENPYALPAIADGRELHATLIAMAKQALTELYRWTGAKVDAACFQVTDMGGVAFGMRISCIPGFFWTGSLGRTRHTT